LNGAGVNSRNDMKFLHELAAILISQFIPLLPVFKDESYEDEVRLVHTEGSILIDRNTGKPYFVEDNLSALLVFLLFEIAFDRFND